MHYLTGLCPVEIIAEEQVLVRSGGENKTERDFSRSSCPFSPPQSGIIWIQTDPDRVLYNMFFKNLQ